MHAFVEKTAYAVAMAFGHTVDAYTEDAYPGELTEGDVILRPEDPDEFDMGEAVRISRSSAEGSDRYELIEEPESVSVTEATVETGEE